MWKVGDVEPVRVMGAEGYPYGFNVTTEDGKSVVSFAYASRALAEAAATHLEFGSAERNFGSSLRRISELSNSRNFQQCTELCPSGSDRGN